MKYTKRLAVGALLALALISFALFVHNASAQQETKPPKFKLAPAKANGVRADHWEVIFDPKLSLEEFESELERVMTQYDAKLLSAKSPVDKTDKLAKYPDIRCAFLQVPEARARQIAEDSAVVEVTQVYEPRVLFPQLEETGDVTKAFIFHSFPLKNPRSKISFSSLRCSR